MTTAWERSGLVITSADEIRRLQQRVALLTETLRGIRQEKADELLDTDSPGTRGTLEREIAWIDGVLRGEP